ncbi:hypothetical protein [Paenibacillus koleovorans]|uniref:hypothetical protein n=1 Tax=Paenibacillus koleovorans TaxID=121608 RepID=UPI000FDC2606|nr:hypothetical protein [Paenibacillus koleovorans]
MIMLQHCPKCDTKTVPGRFTCASCGHELQQAGTQLEALTYWENKRPQLKYTAAILIGVTFSIVFSHYAPLLAGLIGAAFLYLKDYKAVE